MNEQRDIFFMRVFHKYYRGKRKKRKKDDERCIENIEILQDGQSLGQTLVFKGNYQNKNIIAKLTLRLQTGANTPAEEIRLTKLAGKKEFGPKVLDLWVVPEDSMYKENTNLWRNRGTQFCVKKGIEDDDDVETATLMIIEDLTSQGFEDVEKMNFENKYEAIKMTNLISEAHDKMYKEIGIIHNDLYRTIDGEQVVHNVFYRERDSAIRFIDFGLARDQNAWGLPHASLGKSVRDDVSEGILEAFEEIHARKRKKCDDT